MDIVSHALIGATIASAVTHEPTVIIWFMFYSVFPDIVQFPLYLIVGKRNGRFFPRAEDWQNVPMNDPTRIIFYDIPHSFLFLLLVAFPITYLFKFPIFLLLGYGTHLLLDLFTHGDKWTTKPLYPFPLKVTGYTDAWNWNWKRIGPVWAILILLILVLNFHSFL
jgi:membrane-bound metal-dependent hydrolase YbcI (DUF457 family)